MNYAMAAPIQAALAGDRRVQFFATSSESRADIAAIHHAVLPGTTVISPRRAALNVSTST